MSVPIAFLVVVAGFALIGALADAAVFAFQTVQYGQIQSTSHHSACWDSVLDKAILGHTPRPQLEAKAKACAKLQ